MARNGLTPTQTSRVWNNVILRYSRDDNKEQLLRIRLKVKENNQDIQNPVTPLYQARIVNELSIKVPGRGNFEPRQLTLCYENPSNATGETNLTVYVPYHPTDTNWKEQIRETYDYANALSIVYNGETQTRAYLDPNEDLRQ